MLMNYVFTLDCLSSSLFAKNSELIRSQQTCMFYSYILLLIYDNETMYLLGNQPFFKIHVHRFMAGGDSSGANVISKHVLRMRGLVPL